MIDNSQLIEHWTELLLGHLDGTLSAAEAAEFEELRHNPHFAALLRQLEDDEYIARRMADYTRFDGKEAFRRFETAAGLGRKPAGKLRRWGYTAAGIAAAVALLAGIVITDRLATPDEHKRTMELAKAIFPTPDKVTLTLSDGRQVVLDEATDQQIEGVGRVSYNEGSVRFEAPADAEAATQYNELAVPEGNKCLVTLDDGTRVWLNAKSSLRYPVKFTGRERRVTLVGEGLFDVTHNPAQPFVVEAGKATLRVKGTKFNVRDFADESTSSTTLLEGCVEVSNASGMVTLRPGMQAQTQGIAEALTTREVDAAAYAAWTEDKIAFSCANLGEVLADIHRLYRVEIRVNVDAEDYSLTGKIPRAYSLANVISLLEDITDLEFVMPDEKTLIVNKK